MDRILSAVAKKQGKLEAELLRLKEQQKAVQAELKALDSVHAILGNGPEKTS